MAMHCIKVGEQTEICLDDETGYLWESGGNTFPKFHRSAIDTYRILSLLLAHHEDIYRASEKERTGRKPLGLPPYK